MAQISSLKRWIPMTISFGLLEPRVFLSNNLGLVMAKLNLIIRGGAQCVHEYSE